MFLGQELRAVQPESVRASPDSNVSHRVSILLLVNRVTSAGRVHAFIFSWYQASTALIRTRVLHGIWILCLHTFEEGLIIHEL
jgi:hypothetical protein